MLSQLSAPLYQKNAGHITLASGRIYTDCETRSTHIEIKNFFHGLCLAHAYFDRTGNLCGFGMDKPAIRQKTATGE